jgi:hypothetical protein
MRSVPAETSERLGDHDGACQQLRGGGFNDASLAVAKVLQDLLHRSECDMCTLMDQATPWSWTGVAWRRTVRRRRSMAVVMADSSDGLHDALSLFGRHG